MRHRGGEGAGDAAGARAGLRRGGEEGDGQRARAEQRDGGQDGSAGVSSHAGLLPAMPVGKPAAGIRLG